MVGSKISDLNFNLVNQPQTPAHNIYVWSAIAVVIALLVSWVVFDVFRNWGEEGKKAEKLGQIIGAIGLLILFFCLYFKNLIGWELATVLWYSALPAILLCFALIFHSTILGGAGLIVWIAKDLSTLAGWISAGRFGTEMYWFQAGEIYHFYLIILVIFVILLKYYNWLGILAGFGLWQLGDGFFAWYSEGAVKDIWGKSLTVEQGFRKMKIGAFILVVPIVLLFLGNLYDSVKEWLRHYERVVSIILLILIVLLFFFIMSQK